MAPARAPPAAKARFTAPALLAALIALDYLNNALQLSVFDSFFACDHRLRRIARESRPAQPEVLRSGNHVQAQRSEALLQAPFTGTSTATAVARRTRVRLQRLVAHVFLEAYNIRLPHNARAQSEFGVPVSVSQLEPGDLLFYNTLNRPFSHVGIYLGDDRFVHAPKSGSSVRVESLRTSYWSSRFDGARRINPPI
jgi:hypothetical protein